MSENEPTSDGIQKALPLLRDFFHGRGQCSQLGKFLGGKLTTFPGTLAHQGCLELSRLEEIDCWHEEYDKGGQTEFVIWTLRDPPSPEIKVEKSAGLRMGDTTLEAETMKENLTPITIKEACRIRFELNEPIPLLGPYCPFTDERIQEIAERQYALMQEHRELDEELKRIAKGSRE
jgi:hypothetical protein